MRAVQLQALVDDGEAERARLVAENASLVAQLDKSQKKVTLLMQRILIANKNISALYKTAKAEVDRKDARIRELETQLDRIGLARARGKPVDDEAVPMAEDGDDVF